MYIT
jgi:hypothetical protein